MRARAKLAGWLAGWLGEMSFLSPLHEIGNAEYCSFKPQPSCRLCLVGDSLGASIIRFGQAGSRATECSDGYTGRVLTGNKPLSRLPHRSARQPWKVALVAFTGTTPRGLGETRRAHQND